VTAPPNARPEVPSWRLVATLALAGALAGLAIVFVHQWSEPRIQAHRAAALRDAIREVLRGPASVRTVWVRDGRLIDDLPAGADSAGIDRIYLGADSRGDPVGFAIEAARPGYQDVVRLIFGFDPAAAEVIGMKVLESKETPGLGDRIEKDSAFLAAFRGIEPPLLGIKPGTGSGATGEVDMISGATISSRTVIDAINERLEGLLPLIEAYDRARAAGAGP
jgi:electron transport complex protein RnfG